MRKSKTMYEEWKAQQSGVLSPIQREFVNRLASPRTKALKQSPQTKIDSPPAQPAPVPLPDLGTLQAIVDEYYAWIRHHAAGHDYDDFLRNRGITASPEKGQP
jgi:hypothetical protein